MYISIIKSPPFDNVVAQAPLNCRILRKFAPSNKLLLEPIRKAWFIGCFSFPENEGFEEGKVGLELPIKSLSYT